MAAISDSEQRNQKQRSETSICSVFSHACRWEFTEHDPILHVGQATQRSTQQVILSDAEITKLLAELGEPARTCVFVALATGLRVSELPALQWHDVDFSANTITPARGIVDKHMGGLKTAALAAAYRRARK